MIVVGGKNSANTQRLAHIATDVCKGSVQHVETETEINWDALANSKNCWCNRRSLYSQLDDQTRRGLSLVYGSVKKEGTRSRIQLVYYVIFQHERICSGRRSSLIRYILHTSGVRTNPCRRQHIVFVFPVHVFVEQPCEYRKYPASWFSADTDFIMHILLHCILPLH